MPTDHGCRLHEHDSVQGLQPNSVEPHPDEAVNAEQSHAPRALLPQDADLMSRGDDLKFQRGAVTQAEREYRDKGRKKRDHAHDAMVRMLKSPGVLGNSEF